MLIEKVSGLLLCAIAAFFYIWILRNAGRRRTVHAGAIFGLAAAAVTAACILGNILNNTLPILLIPLLLTIAGGLPLHIFRSFRDNAARVKIKRLEKRIHNEREKRRTCEEKYRKLFEGSENSILLMDSDLKIKEANITIKRHLDRTHASVVNSNFRDLIDTQGMDRENGRLAPMVLEEKLARFFNDRSPLILTLPLRNSSRKIRNFRITLEFLKQGSDNEILGTLTLINSDSLTAYLIRESQEHEIDNQIITVDEICKRLTRNLIRYTSSGTRNQILLGLREIVLNAMEHGNLEIDFKQKTEALENRRYMQLLNERLMKPEYRNRKIYIGYTLSSQMVEYSIRDEGKGFDYRYFEEQKHQKEGSLALHGRGIMMTRNIFDVVEYSGTGSEVTLRKKF